MQSYFVAGEPISISTFLNTFLRNTQEKRRFMLSRCADKCLAQPVATLTRQKDNKLHDITERNDSTACTQLANPNSNYINKMPKWQKAEWSNICIQQNGANRLTKLLGMNC